MSMMTRILLALVILAGITAFAAAPQTPQPGAQLAAGQTAPTPTATPIPATPASTPAPALTRPEIVLWWPVTLYPAAGSPAEEALLSQLDAFRASYNRSLLLRVKRLEGVGGIMSTLRNASSVAPLALPDLVLLPREEMVTAAQTGLIFPLEGHLPATLIDGLYPAARDLGTVSGTLFGLPFLLEAQHVVYRPAAYPTAPDDLADLVGARRPFALVIGRQTNVSDTLLIQYVAEGGRLADDQGRPVLDEEPLRRLLTQYRAALDDGLLPPDILDALQASNYWGRFQSGGLALIGIDSTTYLAQRANVPEAVAASLVSAESPTQTTLHGWLWALATPDSDRQAAAQEFLTWIMQPDQQGALSQALGRLPSQRAALRLWSDDDYVDLVDRLLSAPTPILPEEVSSSVASALQDALEAVLRREQTPETAAATAVLAVARP
ncbi:MAG: extracellular solute-binding protein [Anaerolineae bacterium]|nr:extracellular solute-binding protein [Anaerolineae bacterium]